MVCVTFIRLALEALIFPIRQGRCYQGQLRLPSHINAHMLIQGLPCSLDELWPRLVTRKPPYSCAECRFELGGIECMNFSILHLNRRKSSNSDIIQMA